MNLPAFENALLAVAERPILGLIVGSLSTAIIQSSSATIGILQELYTTGYIPLIGAIAIVFGDNIGTTVTAVLASLGGSVAAKRTAAAHVLFNIIGSVVFMLFLGAYTNLIQGMENVFLDGEKHKLTISYAHMIFNITNTFIMFWFVKQLVWLVTKIIRGEDGLIEVDFQALQEDLIKDAPVLALESAKKVVTNMGKLTEQMFESTVEYSFTNQRKLFENGMQIEEMLDTIDKKAHDYLVKIAQGGLDSESSQLQASYVDTIRDFERIGDHCTNILQFFEHRYDNKIALSEDAEKELSRLYDIVKESIGLTIKAFEFYDKEAAMQVMEREEVIDRLVIKNRKRHVMRLNNAEASEQEDEFYVDILSNVERIGDHCNNIVINILQDNYYNEELNYEY